MQQRGLSGRVVQWSAECRQSQESWKVSGMQHGIAEVLAESLTTRSTVWRRLLLRRAGLLPTPQLPLQAQATLLPSDQH